MSANKKLRWPFERLVNRDFLPVEFNGANDPAQTARISIGAAPSRVVAEV